MMQYVALGEHLVFAFLGIASIVALAVTIERAVIFRRIESKDPSVFIGGFAEVLRTHDIEQAANFVRERGSGIYAEFADFAITYYKRGHLGLGELLQGRIIEKRVFLERRLTILNTLGNNAPFIGLLGTVLGVVKAFHNLGLTGDAGTELVMKSISTALLATAAGLFVAIPVVMVNNYFTKKVKIIISNMEIVTMEFLASMTHRKTAR
jgi:biopolymer transport protein ExbB